MAGRLCPPGSHVGASRDWPFRRAVFLVFRGRRLVFACSEPRLVKCRGVASRGLAQGLEKYGRVGQSRGSLLLCPEPISVPQDALPWPDATTMETSVCAKNALGVFPPSVWIRRSEGNCLRLHQLAAGALGTL